MKPDLCPFVCHSSGFYVISFAYLLRSQSGYHFIVACGALLRGAVQRLPGLPHLLPGFRKTFPAEGCRHTFWTACSARGSRLDGDFLILSQVRQKNLEQLRRLFHPSRPYQRASTRDMKVRWRFVSGGRPGTRR